MSRTARRAAFATAATAAATQGSPGFFGRVAALPRLVRDVLTGRYDGLSRGRLALMALALLYIVSPIDLLPEALLTIPGLTDDAAVAAWLIASALGAAAAYRSWQGEEARASAERVVPGEVLLTP
jgi:uncharacterized membrane protein YkvA (DUF1232 family)